MITIKSFKNKYIDCCTFDEEYEVAKTLLKEGEIEIPPKVISILEFCTSNNLGFILSRNQHATSCLDAHKKRNRLGAVGIPLYEELKSYVGIGYDINGKDIIFAAHTRADTIFNLDAISNHLNLITSTVQMLPEEDLIAWYSLSYGIVNPLSLYIQSRGKIIQIFDVSLNMYFPSHTCTMMTNAGDHTWGIEFDPIELKTILTEMPLQTISRKNTEINDKKTLDIILPKTLGIITGNGPDTGMLLWKKIIDCISEILEDRFLGDISLPEVKVVSLPYMGLSMELCKRKSVTWEVLKQAVEYMAEQEVNILALPCHTTSYFADQIKQLFNSDNRQFISMPEVVINHITQNGLDNLAVLGIDSVCSLGALSPYAPLSDRNVLKLSQDSMNKFHIIGYEVKRNTDHYKTFRKFVSLVNEEINDDIENIVIALTELSILLDTQNSNNRKSKKHIVDGLQIYASYLANTLFDKKIESKHERNHSQNVYSFPNKFKPSYTSRGQVVAKAK